MLSFLKVENLSFKFEYRLLFHDLSFSLKKGQLLHIKGPNGCGKTTLLKILAGLISPNDGMLIYQKEGGEPLSRGSSCLEYLAAEKNGHFLHLDARENLDYWYRFRHKKLDIDLNGVLEEWGLPSSALLKHFPVAHFSTGMKRRLALARVKISKTSCWLLDEPLNGLDLDGIDIFKDTLKKHIESGGMAIIVSHDERSLESLSPLSLSLKG